MCSKMLSRSIISLSCCSASFSRSPIPSHILLYVRWFPFTSGNLLYRYSILLSSAKLFRSLQFTSVDVLRSFPLAVTNLRRFRSTFHSLTRVAAAAVPQTPSTSRDTNNCSSTRISTTTDLNTYSSTSTNTCSNTGTKAYNRTTPTRSAPPATTRSATAPICSATTTTRTSPTTT